MSSWCQSLKLLQRKGRCNIEPVESIFLDIEEDHTGVVTEKIIIEKLK